MTFLNKLNSARIGKIFARWHLAIGITSECIFLIALKTTTILSEKKKSEINFLLLRRCPG